MKDKQSIQIPNNVKTIHDIGQSPHHQNPFRLAYIAEVRKLAKDLPAPAKPVYGRGFERHHVPGCTAQAIADVSQGHVHDKRQKYFTAYEVSPEALAIAEKAFANVVEQASQQSTGKVPVPTAVREQIESFCSTPAKIAAIDRELDRED